MTTAARRSVGCGGRARARSRWAGPRPGPTWRWPSPSESRRQPGRLLLFYGVYSDRFDTDSCRAFATGHGFTLQRLREIFDLYDPGARHRDDPRLCPLKGDLGGLPPVVLVAAELDVLADDSRALHAALTRAGVESSLHVEPGVTHGFINRGRLVPAADASLTRAASFLAGLTKPERP